MSRKTRLFRVICLLFFNLWICEYQGKINRKFKDHIIRYAFRQKYGDDVDSYEYICGT